MLHLMYFYTFFCLFSRFFLPLCFVLNDDDGGAATGSLAVHAKCLKYIYLPIITLFFVVTKGTKALNGSFSHQVERNMRVKF